MNPKGVTCLLLEALSKTEAAAQSLEMEKTWVLSYYFHVFMIVIKNALWKWEKFSQWKQTFFFFLYFSLPLIWETAITRPTRQRMLRMVPSFALECLGRNLERNHIMWWISTPLLIYTEASSWSNSLLSVLVSEDCFSSDIQTFFSQTVLWLGKERGKGKWQNSLLTIKTKLFKCVILK